VKKKKEEEEEKERNNGRRGEANKEGVKEWEEKEEGKVE
jgi:hypothetical protein